MNFRKCGKNDERPTTGKRARVRVSAIREGNKNLRKVAEFPGNAGGGIYSPAAIFARSDRSHRFSDVTRIKGRTRAGGIELAEKRMAREQRDRAGGTDEPSN